MGALGIDCEGDLHVFLVSTAYCSSRPLIVTASHDNGLLLMTYEYTYLLIFAHIGHK